jgi:hypothetical protein
MVRPGSRLPAPIVPGTDRNRAALGQNTLHHFATNYERGPRVLAVSRLQYDLDTVSFLLVEKFVTCLGFLQFHAMSYDKRWVDAIVLDPFQE